MFETLRRLSGNASSPNTLNLGSEHVRDGLASGWYVCP